MTSFPFSVWFIKNETIYKPKKGRLLLTKPTIMMSLRWNYFNKTFLITNTFMFAKIINSFLLINYFGKGLRLFLNTLCPTVFFLPWLCIIKVHFIAKGKFKLWHPLTFLVGIKEKKEISIQRSIRLFISKRIFSFLFIDFDLLFLFIFLQRW